MALAAPWQGVPASQTEVKRLGGLLYTKCYVNQVQRGGLHRANAKILSLGALQLLYTALGEYLKKNEGQKFGKLSVHLTREPL